MRSTNQPNPRADASPPRTVSMPRRATQRLAQWQRAVTGQTKRGSHDEEQRLDRMPDTSHKQYLSACVGRCPDTKVALLHVEALEASLGMHPPINAFIKAHVKDRVDPYNAHAQFFQLLRQLSELMKSNDFGIDTAVQHLLDDECRDGEDKNRGRQLIFTLLGWLTMLYVPRMDLSSSSLSVEPESSECFETRSQHVDSCQSSFIRMLHGFGRILPGQLPDDSERPYHDDVALRWTTLNAAYLFKKKGLKIEWTLSLGSHLSIDMETRTLKLFARPSFYDMHRGTSGVVQWLINNFHSQRSRPQNFNADQIFGEIDKSFHILFQNDAESQQRYWRHDRFRADKMGLQRDPRLDELCCPSLSSGTLSSTENLSSFDRTADFPVLQRRWATLQKFVKDEKPNRIRALWNDRPDLKDFLTFWSVVFFGTIGVVLAVISLVLQAIQTVYSVKAYNQGATSTG